MVYMWFTYLEMLSFNRYQQKYPLKMVYDFTLPRMVMKVTVSSYPPPNGHYQILKVYIIWGIKIT